MASMFENQYKLLARAGNRVQEVNIRMHYYILSINLSVIGDVPLLTYLSQMSSRDLLFIDT